MAKIDLATTFERALFQGINLFTGAGFSLLAEDAEGRPLPTGADLARELSQYFDLSRLASMPLGRLCTIIGATKREELLAFLKKRFTVATFDSAYKSLLGFEIRSIFTTNIDDLVPRIYADSPASYINDIRMRGVQLGDRASVNFVPLHACVTDEDPRFVFEATDLAAQFSVSPDKWHFLTQALQDYPTLFWGYSLEDAGVLQALNAFAVDHREHQKKWIVVQEDDAHGIEYFEALGFHIIRSTTQDMLRYFLEVKRPAELRTLHAELPTIFEGNRIPAVGSVPVRPLVSFFLGEAPVWSDIMHRRLHKTKHFDTLLETINSERNAIALGMPACGKTTLLMQLAFEAKHPGERLVFFDSIPMEKARLIARTFAGSKALIFVDNFSDDMKSFQYLSECPNVQLVGFDREYSFEVAAHLLDLDKFAILNVSDLEDQRDIQEIVSRIPPDIRGSAMKNIRGKRDSLGIFELVEVNTRFPRLRARFKKVVEELQRDSPQILEMLVMSCYVHSCRTPVSLGMVYAFFREDVPNRGDVDTMRQQLGAMLKDFTDVSFVGERDYGYFTPRSTHLSETVLAQVRAETLAQVLQKFFRQLSRFRICRYDVFQRKAYDSAIISTAFPNWEDGRAFYEMILAQVDSSYYVKQQAALYLAGKRRFRDAFQWIDESLIESQYRAFTIRNSHAIILFNANYFLDSDDPSVRGTLDESMQILRDCYNSDRRKEFHADKFADQAIRYYNKFPDSVALEYLYTAREWLTEEMPRSPWNRKLRKDYDRVCAVLTRAE